MLNNMIEQSENGKIIEIDPLDQNSRSKILDIIIKKKEILYPGDFIRSNVSRASYEKMKKQLNNHKQVIMRALYI